MTQEIPIHEGSSNVFADLGLPNSEEILVKAELVRQLGEAISQQNLTQMEAAQLLGIDQPKVSALMRGKLTGFSLERLLRFMNILGRDVEIVVKPKPQERMQARTTIVC
jgi:predicted XRE-type DNA-binding protein